MSKSFNPVIALSSRVDASSDALLQFANNHNFRGIEYTILAESDIDLSQEIQRMRQLAQSGLEIRYHTPFKKIEFAHIDPEYAKTSTKYMKKCLDVIANLGGRYVTLHLGLGFRHSPHQLDQTNALKNLHDIVNYGSKHNITVCLENLTFGLANTPASMLEFARSTGAALNVDIGHVLASPTVENKEISGVDFIKELSPLIQGAHVYEIEKFDTKTRHAYHVAPQNLNMIRPLLEELLKSPCRWWLIELPDRQEVINTHSLLSTLLLGDESQQTR